MSESFPISVHTVYHDLLEAHRLQSMAQVPGTPFLRDMGAKGSFWYASERTGNTTKQRYLGPDTIEMRAQIEQIKHQKKQRAAFDRRATAWVAQLRAAGVPTLDRQTGKVLHALSKSGVFRLGGTLIGTHAFRLYSAELGVRFDGSLSATEDIDIAAFENLKLVIDDQVDPELTETLAKLDLEPAPGLDTKRRITKWVLHGGSLAVEFLVPKMTAKQEVVKLPQLGVHGYAMPFLNYLIADPIPAVALYRSGLLVQIPRPERYAVHKLIVATRRPTSSALKKRKDLAQAELLFEVLTEDRPDELMEAYRQARNNGPKWRTALDRAIAESPRIRDCLTGSMPIT